MDAAVEAGKFTWDVGSGVVVGVVDAGIETVKGVGTMIMHPVETATGIGNALLHPCNTLNTIGNKIATDFDEQVIHGDRHTRSMYIGGAIFELATFVVGTKGVDKLAKGSKVSKVSKVSKLSKVKSLVKSRKFAKNVANYANKEYQYDECESKLIVPFAITGGGDKWVWVINNINEEYCVGLCERAELNGVYYAKNTQDAILRQIIEYVANSNFYLTKDEAKSYQVSEEELKTQLEGWKKNFSGILEDKYINVINGLSELSLKHIRCQYGQWYALLTLEEQERLIDKYIKFDRIDEEFEWYID